MISADGQTHICHSQKQYLPGSCYLGQVMMAWTNLMPLLWLWQSMAFIIHRFCINAVFD